MKKRTAKYARIDILLRDFYCLFHLRFQTSSKKLCYQQGSLDTYLDSVILKDNGISPSSSSKSSNKASIDSEGETQGAAGGLAFLAVVARGGSLMTEAGDTSWGTEAPGEGERRSLGGSGSGGNDLDVLRRTLTRPERRFKLLR